MALTDDQNKELTNWVSEMEKFSIGELRKAVEEDSLEVGLIILTVVGIDVLGAYWSGKERATPETFKEFLRKYFSMLYDQAGFLDKLYYLRCGLVHQYKINGDIFYFVRDESEGRHLSSIVVDNKSYIIFNRKIFAQDFIKAWESYSKEIFEDEGLARNVLKKMGQQLVVGNIPSSDEGGDYLGVTGSAWGIPAEGKD